MFLIVILLCLLVSGHEHCIRESPEDVKWREKMYSNNLVPWPTLPTLSVMAIIEDLDAIEKQLTADLALLYSDMEKMRGAYNYLMLDPDLITFPSHGSTFTEWEFTHAVRQTEYDAWAGENSTRVMPKPVAVYPVMVTEDVTF